MAKNNNIKLTNHITYRIIDNTIYLFQNKMDIPLEEVKIAHKKLSLLIEDNDISYISVTARKIEDRKEFYHNLGFTLSYFDVNKLNLLYKGTKDKALYKCYGIMTKKDFFDKEKGKEDNFVRIESPSYGYISDVLLLSLATILLCYFCVQGAIYLVK